MGTCVCFRILRSIHCGTQGPAVGNDVEQGTFREKTPMQVSLSNWHCLVSCDVFISLFFANYLLPESLWNMTKKTLYLITSENKFWKVFLQFLSTMCHMQAKIASLTVYPNPRWRQYDRTYSTRTIRPCNMITCNNVLLECPARTSTSNISQTERTNQTWAFQNNNRHSSRHEVFGWSIWQHRSTVQKGARTLES